MRPKAIKEFMLDELVAAIGLVWGHLHAHQYEEAWQLSKVCLEIWPGESSLTLMNAFAAVEVLEPFDRAALERLRHVDTTPWIDLVLNRATELAPADSVSSQGD
ncbi:MAG: hypothetical protein ACRYGK_00645 [Janthinobacterium lividum]